MCRAPRVARGDFHEWLRESVSNRAREDARLLDLIRHSHAASHGVHGARRVFGDPREVGERRGLHRFERVMRTHKIKAVRGTSRLARSRGVLRLSRRTIRGASSQTIRPTRSG